jgi:hypothetical protein
MKPRRIALYARVSTKDKGQDTENQRIQLREFAAKQDWTIVHEYVNHFSGRTAEKRPQFQAMLAAASRREFDLVLFWSLNRFSREGVLPTLKYLEVLTSYGVARTKLSEPFPRIAAWPSHVHLASFLAFAMTPVWSKPDLAENTRYWQTAGYQRYKR